MRPGIKPLAAASLLAVIFQLSALNSSADTVKLKTGKQIEGVITSETADTVTVDVGVGEVTLNRKDIALSSKRDKNAALYYLRAADMADYGALRMSRKRVEELNGSGFRMDAKELGRLIEVNKPVFAIIGKALAVKDCDFYFESKYNQVGEVEQKSNQKEIMYLHCLLLLEGRYYEGRKDPERAVGSYLSALDFARQISQGRDPEFRLAALITERDAYTLLKEYLKSGAAGPTACRRILDYLNVHEKERFSRKEFLEGAKEYLKGWFKSYDTRMTRWVREDASLDEPARTRIQKFIDELTARAKELADKYYGNFIMAAASGKDEDWNKAAEEFDLFVKETNPPAMDDEIDLGIFVQKTLGDPKEYDKKDPKMAAATILTAAIGYDKKSAELYSDNMKELEALKRLALAGAVDVKGGAPLHAEDRPSPVRTIEDFKEGAKKSSPAILGKADEGEKPVEGITIYLKRGGVVRGKLLEDREKEYEIEWKGAKYVVPKKSAGRVEIGPAAAVMWPYKNKVVVRKTNGIILDGEIADVGKDRITMAFSEGGGGMDMDVKRNEIDRLIFAPVCNRESEDTEARLKKLFPKMDIYKEENFTLFTDAKPAMVKECVREINGLYTEVYFKFFKLFRDKTQRGQNFMVLFDSEEDYADYQAADLGASMPGMAGYFVPEDKTLYIYNGWGEGWDKFYFEWVMEWTKTWEDSGKAAKESLKDGSAGIVVGGIVKAATDNIWNWYFFHKNLAMERTFLVMRHEFTHEIFHNWGLQMIVMYKPDVDKDKAVQKKKEILDAMKSKDHEKAEKLFIERIKLEHGGFGGIELVSNSWMVEGIALYCDTTPIGAIDESRLFAFQEMQGKGEVNPLEFFANFNKGSFVGLEFKALLNAYAQSWAFTSFLMDRYPDRFIEYQRAIAEEVEKGGPAGAISDNFTLLLKYLGKDLPALEKEFLVYMKTYKRVDDPSMAKIMQYQKLKDEFNRIFQFGG